MKRIVLTVLLALVFAAPAEAHFLDFNSVRNHIRDTKIEGWCGKSFYWSCDSGVLMSIGAWSWDHDGDAREGYHSREWYATWIENHQFNPFDDRTCDMWFREYHYEFAERYRGPECRG